MAPHPFDVFILEAEHLFALGGDGFIFHNQRMFHISLDRFPCYDIPFHPQDPGHGMDQGDSLGFRCHQDIRPLRHPFGQFCSRLFHDFRIPQDHEPSNGQGIRNIDHRQRPFDPCYIQFIKPFCHLAPSPFSFAFPLSTGRTPVFSRFSPCLAGIIHNIHSTDVHKWITLCITYRSLVMRGGMLHSTRTPVLTHSRVRACWQSCQLFPGSTVTSPKWYVH